MQWLYSIFLSFLLVLFIPSPGQAQTTGTENEVQADFDAALQDLDANRLRAARERLTTLLSTNPSLSRARLELARAWYLSGNYQQARQETEQVLDDPNTPPTVRVTLLAFLAQIEADEKQNQTPSQWVPAIYAGLMYDTNVNIGPSRDVIEVGGVPFSVLPESQPTEDFALVISPGIVHTYNPGHRFQAGEHSGFFLWQSQANAYQRSYFQETDFNLGVLTLRTGPAFVVPNQWQGAIGLQVDQIFLGGSNLAFYTTLNPNIVFQVGEVTEVALDSNFSHRAYKDADESGREGWYGGGNVLVTRYLRDRQVGVQIGVGWARFDAETEVFAYNGPDLLVGVLWEAWKNALVYARSNYRGYNFGGVEPLFAVTRKDREYRYSLGFQQEFTTGILANWSLVGGWIYTDNQSNVALYDYARSLVNLGLSRSF